MNRRLLFKDVPERTRKTMRAIRSTETKPERLLRSLLHRAGYRFRKNVKGVPGSPDVAIKGRKKAIFVHGCFWHQHPGCRHAKIPRTRPEYWVPKLQRIAERDQQVLANLQAAGWEALIVWECAVSRSPAEVVADAADFLGPATRN